MVKHILVILGLDSRWVSKGFPKLRFICCNQFLLRSINIHLFVLWSVLLHMRIATMISVRLSLGLGKFFTVSYEITVFLQQF